jgi:pyruvate dehydrogenase E1 component beta subunit
MSERIISFGEAIQEGLREALADDDDVFLMGQGIADPSSFWGTTKEVSGGRPERTLDVPVAESAMIGAAIGAAMAGRRPVVSLHRVEFALLAVEQIVNNAAKAHYASNGQHRVPIVIRMIVGRGWGQGPEHSQSLESMWALFPGLKVVMPSLPGDAKGMLQAAIRDDNPVVWLENRWLHYVTGDVPEGLHVEALDGPRVVHAGTDATVVSTSYMTLEAIRAAEVLTTVGCSVEVLDLRVLRPLELGPIKASLAKTGHLVTVDSGAIKYGAGAEIVASLATDSFDLFASPPARLGLPDHPTPSSRGLVPGYYPDAARIIDAVADQVGLDADARATAHATHEQQRAGSNIDQPDPSFKGPF